MPKKPTIIHDILKLTFDKQKTEEDKKFDAYYLIQSSVIYKDPNNNIYRLQYERDYGKGFFRLPPDKIDEFVKETGTESRLMRITNIKDSRYSYADNYFDLAYKDLSNPNFLYTIRTSIKALSGVDYHFFRYATQYYSAIK